MCEESSSIELKSLDIALCVDEVTQVLFILLKIKLGLIYLNF